jgi:hypothetical protein
MCYQSNKKKKEMLIMMGGVTILIYGVIAYAVLIN